MPRLRTALKRGKSDKRTGGQQRPAFPREQDGILDVPALPPPVRFPSTCHSAHPPSRRCLNPVCDARRTMRPSYIPGASSKAPTPVMVHFNYHPDKYDRMLCIMNRSVQMLDWGSERGDPNEARGAGRAVISLLGSLQVIGLGGCVGVGGRVAGGAESKGRAALGLCHPRFPEGVREGLQTRFGAHLPLSRPAHRYFHGKLDACDKFPGGSDPGTR
jgi:hypothetical protein